MQETWKGKPALNKVILTIMGFLSPLCILMVVGAKDLMDAAITLLHGSNYWEKHKKVLFAGVRNKNCSICTRAENKNIEMPHKCYKNWSGSSSAMEADIVVEGFNKSIATHNLKYLCFIADGDSSVHSKIINEGNYGLEVTKIKCTNHLVKNVGKTLHKIKKDTSIDITARRLLTLETIKRIQSYILKCANDDSATTATLKANITNAPNHAFGNHRDCTEIICNIAGNISQDKSGLVHSSGLIYHINGALDNIKKLTYMSILCKLNCGKRLNLTSRGSFQTRVYLTCLRYNEGLTWQLQSWKKYTGIEPGPHFAKHVMGYETSRARRSKNERPLKRCRLETEYKKNLDYGVHAVEAPLSAEELQSESERILNSLQVSTEEQFTSSNSFNWTI